MLDLDSVSWTGQEMQSEPNNVRLGLQYAAPWIEAHLYGCSA